MLEVRHIAGDSDLSSLLVSGARRQWRTGIASRFDELVEHTQQRWQRSGQIAHRAEPDLKTRSRWSARLSSCSTPWRSPNWPTSIQAGRLASPTTRRWARRTWPCSTFAPSCTAFPAAAVNSLLAQHADEIGAALRIGDRFDLARMLSDAARTDQLTTSTAGLRTAAERPAPSWIRRVATAGAPSSSTKASSSSAGEVILARDARPERDPGLILRVAAASADHRPADGSVHRGPTLSEGRAEPADAVAASGGQRPVGDAGRGSAQRWPPSRRWTERVCGAGCSRSGVRCVTCRRATSCISGRWTATSLKPSRGQAHSLRACRGPICLLFGAL